MQHVTLHSARRLRCYRLCLNILALPLGRAQLSRFSDLTFDAKSQPIVHNDDRSRTLRTRKHGNRNLPLPTILDPITIEARTKHEKPKERVQRGQHENLTQFQKELSTNAYAQALATPVRKCLITKVRLPAQLLIPFVQNMIVPDGRDDAFRLAKPMLVPAVTFKTDMPMARVHGTREVIAHLPGKKGKWISLVTERMKQKQALRTQKSVDKVKANEWKLRDGDNIAAAVHEKLGTSLVNALRWCLQSEEHIVVPLSETMSGNRVACIISTSKDQVFGGTDLNKAQFYNLKRLLPVAQVRQVQEMFGDGDPAMAVLKHPHGVITQLALLRLEHFQADGVVDGGSNLNPAS